VEQPVETISWCGEQRHGASKNKLEYYNIKKRVWITLWTTWCMNMRVFYSIKQSCMFIVYQNVKNDSLSSVTTHPDCLSLHLPCMDTRHNIREKCNDRFKRYMNETVLTG
jgi:hypothetical protein